MPVFTRMTGQDFNVGDTALRRAMLEAVRTDAPVHAFVGDHADDYVEALGLHPRDTAYSDQDAFDAALRAAAKGGPVAIMDKPGAFKAAHRFGRYWHRALLSDLRVRRSGGVILRLGGGVQTPPSWAQRAMMRTSTALSEDVLWRDTGTADWFGHGGVMPDWAFALPPSGARAERRSSVAISVRADRPAPPFAWLDTVAGFCAERSLAPVMVSQVRIDDDYAGDAARHLGCEAVLMEGRTHLAQEARVRDAYARCALALSDRLHVLILAMTEGAVPACLLPLAEDKIERHFAAIGYEGVAADMTDAPPADLARAMDRALDRTAEANARCEDARARVQEIGRAAQASVNAALRA